VFNLSASIREERGEWGERKDVANQSTALLLSITHHIILTNHFLHTDSKHLHHFR